MRCTNHNDSVRFARPFWLPSRLDFAGSWSQAGGACRHGAASDAGDKVQDYRFTLLPVFSNLLEPDPEMTAHIERVREPDRDTLAEELAITEDLLYRRGNFNGTFDELIVQALKTELDAEVAFSPGFRWGTSVLPGKPITLLDVAALGDIAAVVVLGAGWEPEAEWPAGTRLGDSSVHRLMEGLRLLQGLPEAQLVVSGASRRANEPPVALGYAAAAQELGVPAERIVALDTPTDTAQEAYAVRDMLGTEARFVLVTSASHMPRSVRHFERAGLSPIAAPAHYLTGRDGPRRIRYWVPSSDALRKTERAVYEYLGLRALEWDHRGR